ncbi:MAG: TRAP transporter large permease subunit [Spirochaetaceae bacterium]
MNSDHPTEVPGAPDAELFREEAGHPVVRAIHHLENGLNIATLVLLAGLPVVEIVARSLLRAGIPHALAYTRHLVLLAGYIGGMLAARQRQHLAIATTGLIQGDRAYALAEAVAGFLAVTMSTGLTIASLEWALTAFGPNVLIGALPAQPIAYVVPFSFLVMTVRFYLRLRPGVPRIAGAVGILFGLFMSGGSFINLTYILAPTIPEFVFPLETFWFSAIQAIAIPMVAVLILAAGLGTPLFVVLGGIAFLLFARAGGVMAVVPNEGYTMLTSNTVPAIPLFTFVGYILSESNAGQRLFKLFRELFGWLPGGMVIAAILVSVFFASFTGASGVVILALGALLYVILHERGTHTEGFTVGLLTGVGDLGLLFPPSLVIILYGTAAQVNILEMFLGGILPGLVTVAAFCTVGVIVSRRRGEHTHPFRPRAALHALRGSFWEVLLPVVILVAYFSGLTTLVETGAFAVVYVVVVEVAIHRELTWQDFARATLKSATIMGGVLVILGAARGISFYIVDSRAPFLLAEWVQTHIDSRVLFLLLLNIALLFAGAIMDIFSAILIIVPLILPLGEVFGIHPVHLGVIFIANMALGFITPPVGLELFLSSYRFGKPLTTIYRYVLPFFVLQLAMVLVITYVPWLSTVLLPLAP